MLRNPRKQAVQIPVAKEPRHFWRGKCAAVKRNRWQVWFCPNTSAAVVVTPMVVFWRTVVAKLKV